MNRLRSFVWGVPVPILVVVVAGCQTPAAVYELAEKTSANAGTFQHYLGELSAHSKTLAETRAEHIASMDAFNARLDSFIKRELYMRQHSNTLADGAKIDALMKDFTSLRDEIIRIEGAARTAEQDRRDKVLSERTDLNAYQAGMRDVANALNALATRESAVDRAKFIGKYLQDVRGDVRASLEKSDKTSQAAKALVDKIRTDLKGANKFDSNEAVQ